MAKVNKSILNYRLAITQNTGTAINTCNTQLADLNYTAADPVGMRIKQVEYSFYSTANDLVAESLANQNRVAFGLSQFNIDSLTTRPPISQIGVIDWNLLHYKSATEVGFQRFFDPVVVKKFTDLYPDGLLIHPSSLYLWTYTVSAITTGFDITAQIQYSLVDLNDSEYQQLINSISIQRF